MEDKNKLIGCCGLNCENCDVRIATINNDDALKEKTAILWTKLNGVTITKDMINCVGCRLEGVKTLFCNELCPIRKCTNEKKIGTYAECEKMDKCKILHPFLMNNPSALEKLNELKNSNVIAMKVNENEYKVIKLIGKGKGGYSYLVTDGNKEYVLKQIHHQPCEYYNFGDKLQSELRDYETLLKLGITMPKLLDVDIDHERILKEYIAGETVADELKEGHFKEEWISKVKEMCSILYAAGINIDYYPTNFVFYNKLLYYIDYECNAYMSEWNFENRGNKYWTAEAWKPNEK